MAVQFKGFSKSGNLDIIGVDSIKWRISEEAKAERMGLRMRGGHRVRKLTPGVQWGDSQLVPKCT